MHLRLLIALLLLSILYRVFFFAYTYSLWIDPVLTQIAWLSFGLMNDAVICLFGTLLLVALQPIVLLRQLREMLALILFFLFTIIYVVNIKIYSTIFTNLKYIFFRAYIHAGSSLLEMTQYLCLKDYMMLIIMLSIYPIIKVLSRHHLKNLLYYFVLPTYFISMLLFAANATNLFLVIKNSKRMISLFINPVNEVAYTFIKSFNQFNRANYPITTAQIHSVKLIDPVFLQTSQQTPITFNKGVTVTSPLNVVILVMESVGADYVFQKTNHKVAMPFLEQLSQQGVWFENHYSGGNISALGEFSIFTGIYPNSIPNHFEMRKDLGVPSIATWLGHAYDSFFVSPSNDLYFALGINKSFSEYDNAKTISPGTKQLYLNMFLDENKGIQFFLNRLNHAKTPFLAVYWGNATHYPYVDYAGSNRLTNETTQLFNRYMNNLHFLDHEIHQIYDLLRDKKLLDNTIFVIVGDHGESFEQHANFLLHGNSVYQEEIKVPLLIYSPKILPPQKIKALTSHIDILPTLLSIMNINYGTQLQGESLLASAHSRKYLFAFGDEDDIMAIDQKNNKMVISFSNNDCKVFDLNRDPQEQHPLPCLDQKQQEAILKFRNFQPQILASVDKLGSGLNPSIVNSALAL